MYYLNIENIENVAYMTLIHFKTIEVTWLKIVVLIVFLKHRLKWGNT